MKSKLFCQYTLVSSILEAAKEYHRATGESVSLDLGLENAVSLNNFLYALGKDHELLSLHEPLAR